MKSILILSLFIGSWVNAAAVCGLVTKVSANSYNRETVVTLGNGAKITVTDNSNVAMDLAKSALIERKLFCEERVQDIEGTPVYEYSLQN